MFILNRRNVAANSQLFVTNSIEEEKNKKRAAFLSPLSKVQGGTALVYNPPLPPPESPPFSLNAWLQRKTDPLSAKSEEIIHAYSPLI